MRRSKSKRQSRAPRTGSSTARTVVADFRCPSFVLAQTTSGTGGLTTLVSGASLANANIATIDPFSLGGLPYNLAALFLEYRFRKLQVSYIPWETSSGVAVDSSAAGTPSYVNRAYAWGLYDDPAYSNTATYSALAAGGATITNTSRASTLILGGPRMKLWRFTTTTSASPSLIDLRMVAPAELRMAFNTTSTTNNQTYGVVMFHGTIEVRGYIDRAIPIGLQSSLTKPPQDENKSIKTNENKSNEQPKPAGSWFS